MQTDITIDIPGRLIELLRELQIEAAAGLQPTDLGVSLADDLAMDSQEVVDLVCELERAFAIKLRSGEVTRGMLLSEVAALVAARVGGNAAPPLLEPAAAEGTLHDEIEIDAPVSEVYACLHRMERWPELLPHVEAIEVVYDDGRYQEFWMSVKGVAEGSLRVRSVRKCEPDAIAFFQPEPPGFLGRHGGGWRFEGLPSGATRLVTYHRWALSESAATVYPSAERSTAEQVAETMRAHARVTLASWKSVIEARPGRQAAVA